MSFVEILCLGVVSALLLIVLTDQRRIATAYEQIKNLSGSVAKSYQATAEGKLKEVVIFKDLFQKAMDESREDRASAKLEREGLMDRVLAMSDSRPNVAPLRAPTAEPVRVNDWSEAMYELIQRLQDEYGISQSEAENRAREIMTGGYAPPVPDDPLSAEEILRQRKPVVDQKLTGVFDGGNADEPVMAESPTA